MTRVALARLALAVACLFGILGAPRLAFAAGTNDGLAQAKSPLDRTTPRRTMTGFLDAAHAGNFERAAHYLDLRDTPRAEQSLRGPELARELAYVIDKKARIDPNEISDDPVAEPPGTELATASIPLEDEHVVVAVVRIPAHHDGEMWIISRSTVAVIPALYGSFGPSPWQDKMPEALRRATFLGNAAWQWIGLALLIVGGYVVARFGSWALVALARFFAKRSTTQIDDELVGEMRSPLRILGFVVIFRLAFGFLTLTLAVEKVLDFCTFTLLVIGLSSLFLRLLNVASGWAVGHLPRETQYELKRRELRTRFDLLRRVANVIIVVLATAVILTQFSFVRTVGLSVLASAGIAGVVVGLAAQKSVSSVIAGIQLSLTQPFRIGDVVKVDGQLGTVEELSLTNVVLKLGDERRFVVPVSRFLDTSFENWTRKSAQLVGTFNVVLDFAAPVVDIRAAVADIVAKSTKWDQRVCVTLVTDVTQAGVQITVVVSAADSFKLDDLKNEVREKLFLFLQSKDDGAYFATTRTTTSSPNQAKTNGAPIGAPEP